MSSKTRTRKTRTTASTTGSTRTLRSVPDQTDAAKARTDTEDKLWKALHANPNSTAANLSVAAKIGKSTAQKILVKWASDGSVTRTAGIAKGGRRAADLWAITEVDTTPIDTTPVDTPPADDVDKTDAEPTGTAQTDAAANDAQDTVDTEVSEAGESADDGAVSDVATTTDGGAVAPGKKARLASGSLRGMVEDCLRDHPDEEFGPTAIAKALGGKSSGAVSNALNKLVNDGTAVKTKDKPKRFALAPAERAAAPALTK